MELMETAELLKIWEENDKELYSEDAFVAVKKILEGRGEKLPAQKERKETKPTTAKKNLTRSKIALIAAAASVLTTAMHGSVQAIFTKHYNALDVLFHIVGRVIGDLPSAVICFGLVYGLLKAMGVNGEPKGRQNC